MPAPVATYISKHRPSSARVLAMTLAAASLAASAPGFDYRPGFADRSLEELINKTVTPASEQGQRLADSDPSEITWRF